jgi:hypothetical protein
MPGGAELLAERAYDVGKPPRLTEGDGLTGR